MNLRNLLGKITGNGAKAAAPPQPNIDETKALAAEDALFYAATELEESSKEFDAQATQVHERMDTAMRKKGVHHGRLPRPEATEAAPGL